MSQYFKCSICGAVIDSETGETHVSESSNAFNFKEIKQKYEKSQSDLKRALEEHAKLLERLKGHGKNGNGTGDHISGIEGDNTDEPGQGDKGGDGSEENGKEPLDF